MEFIKDSVINFSADESSFNPSKRISIDSQNRLFGILKEYLYERGINHGFGLGRVNIDDQSSVVSVSILECDQYWIVAQTEMGESRFLGIFFSFMDAVRFFLIKKCGEGDFSDFPWRSIFD